MTDLGDQAIKLFGSKIPAEDPDPEPNPAVVEKGMCGGVTDTEAKDKLDVTKEKDQKDHGQSNGSSMLNIHEDRSQISLQDNKVSTDFNSEQDQPAADIPGQEKVLKKPDKILPCPRCKSLNTKFCYYNNYNVNQPRHFCKNCQRYWTAGGTMRNVPVGAGRRKSKNCGINQSLSSIISDPMGPLNGNSAVLTFGPEAPQCVSVSSIPNEVEQKTKAEMGSTAGGENGEEPSCISSTTSSKCVKPDLPEKTSVEEQNVTHGCYNLLPPMHPLQYSPGPLWPYWIPPPPMLCPTAVPFPYMPPPYWPCMPSWHNGPWNYPWSGLNAGNVTPSLGKHSRDGSLHEEEKSEKSLWIPKTLRIDDPDEAAKSSIWSTLGINPDESVLKKGLFKDLQSEDKSSDCSSAPAQFRHANPAALSRSQTFQESA